MNPLHLAVAALALSLAAPLPVVAGGDPFVGEIMLTASGFCPQDWLDADGRTLPVSQYQVLYSLLGTTYGGDGGKTFALPDLRDRLPMGAGKTRRQGETGGADSVTLTAAQLPAHSHPVTGAVMALEAPGSSPAPAGNLLAVNTSAANYGPVTPGQAPVAMAAASLSASAGPGPEQTAAPLRTLPPYLALRYCIAVNGLYPPRPD